MFTVTDCLLLSIGFMIEETYFPGSTRNFSPLLQWMMAARVQATPMPRNTLTALDPVTLPTDASAYLSWQAATLLANVSAFKYYFSYFISLHLYLSSMALRCKSWFDSWGNVGMIYKWFWVLWFWYPLNAGVLEGIFFIIGWPLLRVIAELFRVSEVNSYESTEVEYAA